jgi:YVTN family beta-propeller protein
MAPVVGPAGPAETRGPVHRAGARSGRRSRPYLAALAVLWLAESASAGSYTLFESGPVRPLALSADGTRLFAVNTPDSRLEIFRVSASGVAHESSVPVGLEPVAVAVADGTEVWVVNHLSDSVSVVDVGAAPARVVRTLLVGDEPRDIVFAGPDRGLAFITAAHRGQNVPGDPQLATPGVGRADVWVFDADPASATAAPRTILTLFGDTPRALAASADGRTVYAAVFHSGNQTTALNEHTVCNGGVDAQCTVDGVPMPGGLPEPRANADGEPGPEVGLIVKHDPTSGAWEDELGRDWRSAVRFNLPDYDVFEIDASADPPRESDRFSGVGTILFNMVVHPATGALYVSNTEARNETRFSGPGVLAGHTVRGHLHVARVSRIDPATGAVTAHHLNPHIDYAVVPSPSGVKERSLATPLDMVLSGDGGTLYLAAFGSSAVAILPTAELDGTVETPGTAARVTVSGGGPGGLALDEARQRLYVLTRFDNAISVIDTAARVERQHLPMPSPEPPEIVAGRRFLYDATLTSSNGEASCAGCHVFADVDDLGWDLGDPDGEVQPFGNQFHPLKGPMTVQTLRGIATHGPMHWRGDRSGEAVGGDPKDERLAFLQFNEGFTNLLGREAMLTDAEMESFADFVLALSTPPNPIRALDNTLTANEEAGAQLFRQGPGIGCSCHALMPEQGFFGTAGDITIALETQLFKVPQLRNMYARVGMFGMAGGGMFGVGNTAHMGDQIRGFGYLHDGSVDTLFRFLSVSLFSLDEQQRRSVEAFMLAFPSDLAPIVGQQVTLPGPAASAAMARIDLLIQRAAAGECDLTVKGVTRGEARGWSLHGSAGFRSDREVEAPLSDAALRARASAAAPLTYTCGPPGSGPRLGVDRDEDGFADRDEIDRCGDPADAARAPLLARACAGDCNRDCAIRVDELVRGVRVALLEAPLEHCPAADGDLDGAVAVAELVESVGNSLGGCARAAARGG